MNWETLKTKSIDAVIDWAGKQPWCDAMSRCAQDSQWHAEGDVWTHTQLVLRQLEKLSDWDSLSDLDRAKLVFTALFHDIAKPITTEVDPETGRIRSPKHAIKGEQMARSILRGLECDIATREAICHLVRYHGKPVFLLERKDPVHEVVRLSCLVNNRLLYLFALADSRGRDSDSMDRPEEDLHCWKLVAEEYGCFTTPYPFETDHARLTYCRHPEPNLHYVPHEETASSVTLLSGLPGSGKDYWIGRNRSNLPVVSLDALREELDVDPTDNQGRVAQLARERCRELLREKAPFVFNATNVLRTTRGRWLDLFWDYKARVEIVYVEPPLATIIHQNRNRGNVVPERVIRDLAEKCEPPTILEGHQLTLVTGLS
jgi:putative nucleotidyltransferase with HDIG domain